MNVNPLVEVCNVKLCYHEPHAETVAVDNLTLSVNKGEFVAIVGPSGCGKTTLLSLIAGYMPPSSGSINVNTKSDIGYMLQHDHLLEWRTIEGNVRLGLEVKHLLNDKTRAFADSLINRYGLSEFKNHYPRQLSGGMRQKVALIRTLAFSPELLLLDEPFSALDYQTRLKVAEEVRQIIRSEGKTAILVTHDISEAIALSDRVFVLSKRPATLKSVYEIKLACTDECSLTRRNDVDFKKYFDMIWGDLDD